jgi:hypothetical protein
MNNTKLILGLSIIALSIALGSCKKDKEDKTLDNSSDEAIASFVEKTVESDENTPTLRGGGGATGCNWQLDFPSCAVISESSETYPKVISIDFGDGCTNENGITRSGIIFISLTDDLMNEGAVRTVTFDNYHVNNVQIAGTRVTTNNGVNGNGQPTFTRVVNVDITKNGNTIHRTFNGSLTWLSGYDTEACGDNIFSMTGSGTCTRPNGNACTRTIIEPLIIDRICGYITDGLVEIQTTNGTAEMNFGDGSCDDIAIVTGPNGNEHTVHLHQN